MPFTDADQAEYHSFFHWITTSGLVCGLSHPIEWCINAVRTPGGTLSPDYYQQAERWVPHALAEFYEAVHCQPPTVDGILEWVRHHYRIDEQPTPNGSVTPIEFRRGGFFDRWRHQIQAACEDHVVLRSDPR